MSVTEILLDMQIQWKRLLVKDVSVIQKAKKRKKRLLQVLILFIPVQRDCGLVFLRKPPMEH